MRPLLSSAVAVIALAALSGGAWAASGLRSEAKPLTTEGLDLGKPVCGPEVAQADLKKPMVFEYWGDECPPCLRAIPHLCEVQKKYGREKLTVIANQVWTEDVKVAKKAWEARAPKNYQVSVVNHGAVKNAEVDGVPHAFVFDKEGKLAWQGHPADEEFDKAVAKVVGE